MSVVDSSSRPNNRREPMELYRPGALTNEEREKHRRRAHFGENRAPNTQPHQQQPQHHQHDQRHEDENGGTRRGHSRGRGGGFGRSRGRGVRDFHHNGGHRDHQENGHNNRNGRYDSSKAFTEMRHKKPEIQLDEDEYDISPPAQSTNWADDEYEEIEPSPPLPSNDPPVADTSDRVFDLRDKLNAMRIAGDQKQQKPLEPINDSQQQFLGSWGQRAVNKQKTVAGNLPLPKRNTESFEPSHAPPEMRILAARPGLKHYDRPYSTRDVLVVNDLFCAPDDLTIYNKLLHEIENSGVDPRQLWQSWHGDSHLIADDKRRWKKECPTFHMIVDKLADYFHMDVKATRLNWYRDSSEWKPFHHDAAAVKADKARTQNFTVAVSFGLERDAAFEHAKTKTVISMPQPNGTVYTFGRDVNILWRHGILQVPPDQHVDQGRISIIAWGWNEQFDL